MILSVLDAVNASTGFVRPVREGEQVLNGGLVVAVGVKEKDGDLLRVRTLVLRTSGITSKTPCVIEIWVDLSKPLGFRVTSESSPECDCPAGNSAKCKHITALCYCTLQELRSQTLSCTDIEQQWGEMKAASLKEYQGKRLSELCHVKTQRDVYASTMPEVTKEMEERWRQKLTNCKRPD